MNIFILFFESEVLRHLRGVFTVGWQADDFCGGTISRLASIYNISDARSFVGHFIPSDKKRLAGVVGRIQNLETGGRRQRDLLSG